MEAIDSHCGRSIYFTHVVTELIKGRAQDQTLTEILKLNDTAFLKLKRQFENRLNKIYSHEALGDQLDTQEIDFTVMQVLEELVKTRRKNKLNSTHSLFARAELIHTPIFKALFDLNIIWKSKYYEYF